MLEKPQTPRENRKDDQKLTCCFHLLRYHSDAAWIGAMDVSEEAEMLAPEGKLLSET